MKAIVAECTNKLGATVVEEYYVDYCIIRPPEGNKVRWETHDDHIIMMAMTFALGKLRRSEGECT